MDPQLIAPARWCGIAAGFAVALALAAAHDATAESRPRDGGRIAGSLLSEPTTIDPIAAQSHAEMTLVSLVYDTLYRTDERGRAVPHLAAELPALDSSGLEARITLVAGAVFHRGNLVSAADVVASLERLRKSKLAGWAIAPIASVREEAGVVVIGLSRATPELPQLLSSPHTAILEGGRAPKSWEDAGGSGPYRIAKRSSGKVRLSAWEQHFAGPAYVGELELSWFESGDKEARVYESGGSDLSFRGSIAFAGHKPKYATKVAASSATILSYVGFGTRDKALADVRFRRAVSLAISRDGLKHIGTGERTVAAIGPGAVDANAPAPTAAETAARIPEARRELAKVVSLPGSAIEVLVDQSRPDDRRIAEKVVAALAKLGLAGKVVDADAASFAKQVGSGKCDLYIGQLAPASSDLLLQIAAAFAAGKDDWASRELAAGTLNLVSAVGQFKSSLPIVPLFHRAVRVHHRDNVHFGSKEFDSMARLAYADLYVHGKPRPSP